jgi:hypothetical protein
MIGAIMKIVCIHATILSCIFAVLVSCTNNSDIIAGNGTRIGNPTITGMIYRPDGKTPASNAQVYLRKKSSLPDIGLKKLRTDVALVTTNTSGEFEIDSVEAGTYVIECSDNSENLALYDSVIVENPDTVVNLPADTLKPAGAIKGTIVLPEGGDFGRVYVLVFGVQRFAIVDSNGHFNLENLAEGTYNLRIISSLIHYESLDTTNVPVASEDTTDLTIEMLYNGLSVVKNFAVKNYDTLSRVVTLSWDKIESDLVHGYNVYRKEKYEFSYPLMNGIKNVEYQLANTPFAKVNQSVLKDTVFCDSNRSQNQVYTYFVTAVGVDTLESSASNEVSVTFTTKFSTDTLIEKDFGNFRELKGHNPHKFLYKNGSFYIVADSLVRIYDTLFNQTGVLSNLPARPFEIAADNSGRIYVSIANFSQNEMPENITKIYMYNQNVISGRINLTDTLDSIPALGIGAILFTVSENGNIIFVKNTKDSLYICDSTGTILRKVGGFSAETNGINPYAGINTLATDQNNNIYALDAYNGMITFDAEGVQKRVIQIRFGQPSANFTVAPNGDIYFVSGGLTVFSPVGQIITRFNLPFGETHHIILTGNKMYALSSGTSSYYNPETRATINGTSVIKLTNGLFGR